MWEKKRKIKQLPGFPSSKTIQSSSMDTDEIATRLVGAHMLLVSFCGILINFYMFYFFLKLQKTSFYVLCSSKTISNSIILFAYLLYVGPINFLWVLLFPQTFNRPVKFKFPSATLDSVRLFSAATSIRRWAMVFTCKVFNHSRQVSAPKKKTTFRANNSTNDNCESIPCRLDFRRKNYQRFHQSYCSCVSLLLGICHVVLDFTRIAR